MKRFTNTKLVLIAVLAALLLVLTESSARQSALDQLGLLQDIRYELVHEYVEDPDQQAMVESAIQGMIDSLNDRYTTYLTQEDLEGFDTYITGSFSGIGAEVFLDEQRLRISTPLEDSPAWHAGILAGDIVLEIDGESLEELFSDLRTDAKMLREAISRLKGKEGTDVVVLVRHEAGDEQIIRITRGIINIQTVRGFRRLADQQFDFMLDDDARIGYVRLTSFNERTADDLKAALNQLIDQDVRALVLDVRFNPGGLLKSAIDVTSCFLETDTVVVSVEGRVVPKSIHKSTARPTAATLPLVVLANRWSASASEIVTGALADHERALFVGSRTFGKGSVQGVKELPNGQGALKLTHAYYYLPSGRLIHRREDSEVWGVDPSPGSYVPVTREQDRELIKTRREAFIVRPNGEVDDAVVTPEWVEEHLKDPQLAAALRAALGKLEAGQWPQVGQSVSDELIKAQKRDTLLQRREQVRGWLDQIESGLAELDEDAEVEPEPAVDGADKPESTVDTGAEQEEAESATGSAPESESEMDGGAVEEEADSESDSGADIEDPIAEPAPELQTVP